MNLDFEVNLDLGNAESSKYNEEVVKSNLKFGILEQINCPAPGFQDVVKRHFFFKRDKLIQVRKNVNKHFSF